MAFGLLGSIIPQINRNEILYVSPASTLAFGKVSISSKNYNPVKIRLGVTLDNINVEYFLYNRYINYGETFETEQIHLGDGEKLVVRSSDPNVNFLFYGETVDESTNPTKSGVLNYLLSTNSQKKLLYSAPIDSKVVLTLSVCNLHSQSAKARIGISDDLNAFDSHEYLEYDVEIGPNQTYTRSQIKLDQGQSLFCSSSEDSNINFVCHGRLFYQEISDEDLVVLGNARVNGNLGVGTISARQKLDVVGNGLIDGNLIVSKNILVQSGLVVSGIITGNIDGISLNESLLNLGSLPSIDGSSLTGVIATGIGVVVQDDGINVGTAQSINFGNNLKVNFSGGTATVAITDDVNLVNSFSAGEGRFSVSGATGNTEIAGTLSVSDDINALNNKVINVGAATSSTDATNKSYVDTRSIAMSIALS
jgi:hypothetical protein